MRREFSGRLSRALSNHLLHPPLQRASLNQNATAAAKAAETDVRAKAHNGPVGAAAGMSLPQADDIA